jgi:hypothetical protein
MLEDLAQRADRAMRTMSARRAAEETHMLMLAAGVDGKANLLSALAARRGWQRQGERDFVCVFGDRKGTLTVPSPFDAVQLIGLIARVEINVFLGDSDPVILTELHALAQRELQLLLAAD